MFFTQQNIYSNPSNPLNKDTTVFVIHNLTFPSSGMSGDQNARIVPSDEKDEYEKSMSMQSYANILTHKNTGSIVLVPLIVLPYHIYLPPSTSTNEQLVPIDTSRKLNVYNNINCYDKHHKNFSVQCLDNNDNDHYRINTSISDYPHLSDENRTLLILLNNRPEDLFQNI